MFCSSYILNSPFKIICASLFINNLFSSINSISINPVLSEHWNEFIFFLFNRLLQYFAKKVWVAPVTGSSFVPLQGQKYLDSKSKSFLWEIALFFRQAVQHLELQMNCQFMSWHLKPQLILTGRANWWLRLYSRILPKQDKCHLRYLGILMLRVLRPMQK